MNALMDFIALRPVLTSRVIRVAWYAYLVATVFRLFDYANFSAVGGADPRYYTSLIAPILFAVADLILVRIFLELALRFIDKRTLPA